MKSQTLKLLVKVVCFISLCSTEPHWLNLCFSNKKCQRDEVQLLRKKCESLNVRQCRFWTLHLLNVIYTFRSLTLWYSEIWLLIFLIQWTNAMCPFSKGLLVETECYWQIQLRWIINNYELKRNKMSVAASINFMLDAMSTNYCKSTYNEATIHTQYPNHKWTAS